MSKSGELRAERYTVPFPLRRLQFPSLLVNIYILSACCALGLGILLELYFFLFPRAQCTSVIVILVFILQLVKLRPRKVN